MRGDSFGGKRSLSLPCGMAVGSTWDAELVGELGVALAAEARAKGVQVLLGPTVCIVRTPLAGRTFESFSEDPLLTARLAVAYVRGVQSRGVACCIKHYACNDQEHERMSISAEVDERTLREIHLVAFEAAVQEAGVWALMTAYNKVGGIYCGEQPELINGILRGEWDFDGVAMSDWYGTHSTAPAALAGLDLEMPGPPAWLGPNLAAAVRAGQVDEDVVDGQAGHLLGLMGRVGLLDGEAGRGEERRTTTPAAECWRGGWRPRAPCCWSTTACSPSTRRRSGGWPSSGRTRGRWRWAAELRGDAARTAQPGRGAGRADARVDGDLRGGLPHRPGHSPDRPSPGDAHGRRDRGVHGRVLRRTRAPREWRRGAGAGRDGPDPFGARRLDRPAARASRPGGGRSA